MNEEYNVSKKQKCIVWGTGEVFEIIFKHKDMLYSELWIDYEILAFADNDQNKWGKDFHNKKIISPSQISEYEYDKIVICSSYYEEIRKQCTDELGISKNCIVLGEDLIKYFLKTLKKKYFDCEDQEILDILKHYEVKGFNIFGTYNAHEGKKSLVYRDTDNAPYILFEGKKMYYPMTFCFFHQNGQEYVKDVLGEQGELSPHKYIRTPEDIPENAVIVDAGVCEGNFALRYIEKAKKIYLIEPDHIWMDALKKTFAPYSDKVVFCEKFLGNNDTKDTIKLDSLVKENINFLKMDIEGAEIDALSGGAQILTCSNAKCAICSYHKQYDERNIKALLKTYGYRTSTSKGYMFFIHDTTIKDSLDFRRGIVYGNKI